MNVYHYARVSDWQGIQSGSWQSGDKPGLGNNPRVCLDNYIDEGARNGAVFGLLEPEPDKWVKNDELPSAWPALMAKVGGRVLLAYEPTEEIIEQSFIIDWAHMERFLRGNKSIEGASRVDTRDRSGTTRLEAERAYWASRVPLADYIADPGVITDHALPEHITMCTVPAEIVRVADVQPQLLDIAPYEKSKILRVIDEHPELETLRAYAA